MTDSSMFSPLTDQEKKSASFKKSKQNDCTPILPIPNDVPIIYPRHALGMPAASWDYRDSKGLLFIICRFNLEDGEKTYLPLTYCVDAAGKRRWCWKGLPTPRPLYNLHELEVRANVPILICEGEKSADAGQRLFPDYVASTSPNGAGSADKADWSAANGRDVVIWRDNDDEGLTYSNDVCRLALAAGAASVTIVAIPAVFPVKWDLADDLPEGISEDDLRELVRTATAVTRQSTCTMPPGYFMQEPGLYWKNESDPEKPAIHLSGSFEIVAETRNIHGEAWGILIRWQDHDGRWHEWSLPRELLAGEANEVRARLLSGGLYVSPSRNGKERLTAFLISVKTQTRARCVDNIGWHGLAYVTSRRTYGDAGEEHVILQNASPAPDWTIIGTLEGWQNEIAIYGIGNSRLALAISAALAGPLLNLIGEDSFGFHFYGGSSSGKTTALRIGASVWGCKVYSWRTTDNGAENLASYANDGLLVLDELSQADGKAVDAMAYMLGNGQGKHRMRKNLTARLAPTWRLIFLSTGEIGLADKLSEIGKKSKAGQSVRMIEIPADAERGHKLFENVHGLNDGGSLADHLRHAVDKHNGHAIEEFLAFIVANLGVLPGRLREACQQWLLEYCPANADGQVSRVANRFALTAAAGELASSIGLLPWPDKEASRAAGICFQAWLDRRGGMRPAETMAGITQVKSFIETHGASRFSIISDGFSAEADKTINRAGFRRLNTEGQWDYYVLPNAWVKEVCVGNDARMTARDLIDAGLMHPSKDRPTIQLKVPGLGNTRVYHISSAILSGEPHDA